MIDLGLSAASAVADEDLNEEQFYRILDTQGDVAYAQAIDPPIALLTFGGQTIQQVLSTCVTQDVSAVAASHHSVSPVPSVSGGPTGTS